MLIFKSKIVLTEVRLNAVLADSKKKLVGLCHGKIFVFSFRSKFHFLFWAEQGLAGPDNIEERANAVRRKFSKFADNFDQGWHGLNQVVLTMV